MNRIIILVICICATTARAYFDSTNDLATEAGVWWGNDSLTGNTVTGTTDSSYTSGYSNSVQFIGTATATANYDSAEISMTFSQYLGFVMDFTQQVIRAKAHFTDTFVISGPIGTGTVSYNLRSRDSTTTATFHQEGEPTNIVNPEVIVTRRVIHDGQETEIKPITFGRPFTASFEIEGAITLNGTNYNNMYSVVREASNSLLSITVCDGNGEMLSSGFSIVSSSGGVYPRGPPVFADLIGPEMVVSWHSVTDVIYAVATSSSLLTGAWSQIATGVTGNGHTNTVSLNTTNEHPVFIRLEME